MNATRQNNRHSDCKTDYHSQLALYSVIVAQIEDEDLFVVRLLHRYHWRIAPGSLCMRQGKWIKPAKPFHSESDSRYRGEDPRQTTVVGHPRLRA